MGIKRYIANKDNTITNAYESNLVTRGTGSNMGASDILEVFSIYGQALQPSSSIAGTGSSQTQELSRVLIQFPVNDIVADRQSSDIPASGNIDFYLRLYNAKHSNTVPRNMTLTIVPVSSSWEEGFGLDMEAYSDLTEDEEGSNWMKRSGDTSWDRPGGDYHTGSNNSDELNVDDRSITVTLEKGTENLEVNVTEIVEDWILGSSGGGIENYGLGVYLTASQEAYFSSSTGANTGSVLHNTDGAKRSYYTKKFFARGSEFFMKRPAIEARWDSSKKDNRANLIYSSSLLSAGENINTIYFYNYFRGQLRNIPGIDSKGSPIYINLYSGSGGNASGPELDLVQTEFVAGTVVTGGYEADGIYTASFALTAASTPLTTIYDVWRSGSEDGPALFTGTLTPEVFKASNFSPNPSYVTNITNLKSTYDTKENPRLRLYTRLRDWNPSIYTKASQRTPTEIVEDAYYRVYRIEDNHEVISYGTGSATSPQSIGTAGSYTRLSYDVSGSYFDLDMSLFEQDYMYGIKFAYYVNGTYQEQSEIFKFRVEEQEI